jgi:hypothetical protein
MQKRGEEKKLQIKEGGRRRAGSEEKGTDHIAQHASARERSMPKLASDRAAGWPFQKTSPNNAVSFVYMPAIRPMDGSSWSTSCKQANACMSHLICKSHMES